MAPLHVDLVWTLHNRDQHCLMHINRQRGVDFQQRAQHLSGSRALLLLCCCIPGHGYDLKHLSGSRKEVLVVSRLQPASFQLLKSSVCRGECHGQLRWQGLQSHSMQINTLAKHRLTACNRGPPGKSLVTLQSLDYQRGSLTRTCACCA